MLLLSYLATVLSLLHYNLTLLAIVFAEKLCICLTLEEAIKGAPPSPYTCFYC